ncbi:MAG TPA: iron ABC transporter permease [Abditibacteriaceae bacterium]|nr:iron ABC transporter permease [Abditibacteriaceae bacterium]
MIERESRVRWALLIMAFVVVVVLAAAARAPVPLSDLWSASNQQSSTAQRIFFDIRLPRLLAGLLIGGALATSGAALQAVFRNPLAEPYLLGISAGGALGATVAMALQLPSFTLSTTGHMEVQLFDAPAALAFIGALTAAFLVYRLGSSAACTMTWGRSGTERATLLLTGVALSAFLTALMSLVVALSPRPELAQQTTFWLLGGLANVTMPQNFILMLTLVVGIGMLLASARDLNALRVSDQEAASLGIAVIALHRKLLFAAALMAAAAVSVAGLIGFVGLLAPHLMRLLFGSDARTLIPAAALGGAALLAGCDAVARSAAPPVELPVGIITALLGVPLFLFLARRV